MYEINISANFRVCVAGDGAVFYGSRKGTIQKYFANPKKYFKSQCFFKKSLSKSLSNLKNITNPKKIIGSANNFLKKSKIVYNPRIVVKSRKIFLKSENMFCHVLLAPAVSQR